MGLVSWLLAGLVAFGLARPLQRHQLKWWLELPLALFASAVAGFVATTLDFGGRSVIDWRAIAFAFLCAAAVVPVARLIAPLPRAT